MGMAHPALSHKVTWMRKAKVTGQDSEGIAAAKTLESSNIWDNKWTSWEQEVGWGEQPHTAILAAHRDVVCSSSMLSCTDRDDSLHRLCHKDSAQAWTKAFLLCSKKISLLKTQRCQMLEKGTNWRRLLWFSSCPYPLAFSFMPLSSCIKVRRKDSLDKLYIQDIWQDKVKTYSLHKD